jgi:tripartite-type tricarboxylate transporter receptor subunit TctC
MIRTRRSLAVALAALTLGGIIPARGQDYPSRIIRVIVGPGPDITARLAGAKITEALGQQVVIEPRPGAGGTIAAQAVAGAPPDGYSLLLATAPFVLVVHPSVPAKSLAELIALAKANPGKLNYASSGIGTPPHLAGELFKSMAGVDVVHVPFREANSALNAVVSGSVEMMFSLASTAAAQIDGGKVRGIGVTSPKPSPLVPGLPAIADEGLTGFSVMGWNGLVAPKGTPAPIIDKLSGALQRGLDDADLRQRLVAAGYEPVARNAPDDFARFIAADTAKWVELVEKTKMKSQ